MTSIARNGMTTPGGPQPPISLRSRSMTVCLGWIPERNYRRCTYALFFRRVCRYPCRSRQAHRPKPTDRKLPSDSPPSVSLRGDFALRLLLLWTFVKRLVWVIRKRFERKVPTN